MKVVPFYLLRFFFLGVERNWLIKEPNIGFLIKGFAFFYLAVASSVTRFRPGSDTFSESDARGKIYGCDNI